MRSRVSHAARAFTLLEVMIVIVIILAILGLVTVNLMGSKKSADNKLVKIQLESLRGALDQFYLEYNRYPSEEEGLAVLWSKEALSEEDQGKWHMFTKEALPRDAWGTEWGYRLGAGDNPDAPEGQPYEIWSNGPDKEEGGGDDIYPGNKTGPSDGSGDDFGPPPPPGGG